MSRSSELVSFLSSGPTELINIDFVIQARILSHVLYGMDKYCFLDCPLKGGLRSRSHYSVVEVELRGQLSRVDPTSQIVTP